MSRSQSDAALGSSKSSEDLEMVPCSVLGNQTAEAPQNDEPLARVALADSNVL